MRKTLCAAFLSTMLLASGALGQPAITGPLDPMTFSQLKDFTAHRFSSNPGDVDGHTSGTSRLRTTG
jgi:hypothetical protein